MAAIEVTRPVETRIGTINAGVVGTLVYAAEIRSPDGELHDLATFGRETIGIPRSAYRLVDFDRGSVPAAIAKALDAFARDSAGDPAIDSVIYDLQAYDSAVPDAFRYVGISRDGTLGVHADLGVAQLQLEAAAAARSRDSRDPDYVPSPDEIVDERGTGPDRYPTILRDDSGRAIDIG